MGKISQDIHQASLNGASSPTSTPSDLSLKNKIRAKQIAQGLIDGKTYTQIAKDIGLSRPALYAIMDKQEVQELMTREIKELETTLQNWIQELHLSKSPADRRHAISELGKMTRHVQDKLYPSLFRTETKNINIDLTKHLQREHIHSEIISRMPPTMRNLYWELDETIRQTPTHI